MPLWFPYSLQVFCRPRRGTEGNTRKLLMQTPSIHAHASVIPPPPARHTRARRSDFIARHLSIRPQKRMPCLPRMDCRRARGYRMGQSYHGWVRAFSPSRVGARTIPPSSLISTPPCSRPPHSCRLALPSSPPTQLLNSCGMPKGFHLCDYEPPSALQLTSDLVPSHEPLGVPATRSGPSDTVGDCPSTLAGTPVAAAPGIQPHDYVAGEVIREGA